LDKIKSLTLQSWDEAHTEPPLKIAVKDMRGNHPMSLAFLRGYPDVAKDILEIAKAQYTPEEKEKTQLQMQTFTSDETDSAEESDSDSDSGPRIVARFVDRKFTMENVGQASMQVKSRTRPIEILDWLVPTFEIKNGKLAADPNLPTMSLLRCVINSDDLAGLKALLDMAAYFVSQGLDGDEEEPTRVYAFPESEFLRAIQLGRTQMLAEIIRRTGVGIPLDHLVKKSGVEVKEKPRFYQGLTVYGKKR
jgi:hypothetical protein